MSAVTRRRGACCAFGVLIALGAAAQAEIYQYKDEHGKTVFSERPPPNGAEAKVVKPKTGRATAGAADKLQQDRERILPPAKTEQTATKKKAELTPEQEEQKARACAQAQQALDLLRANNRPRYETEDGQIAHMTPEMQAQREADAADKVSKYCD